MKNRRGQASILIAIIFQILFVFFAMVINVGLLVHDKINLQNSVDIAAYYGAMKQAEVLSAMAQLNYQIRQSWKLLAWRIWVLGDAGRNNTQSQQGTPQDIAATWGDSFPGPAVCVGNPLWMDNYKLAQKQNLCKSNLFVSALPVLKLGPFQTASIFRNFLQVFVNQIQANHDSFENNFKGVGLNNYLMAVRYLASFKIAAAHRRFAIHKLQNYLIQGAKDFQDLSGNSVGATVQNTLMKNLTAGNKAANVTFNFTNGLGGKPFMVPTEVRSFVTYIDTNNINQTQQNSIQTVNVASAQDTNDVDWSKSEVFWDSDFNAAKESESADLFQQETEDFLNNKKAYYSLVGFEKNPWVMAYVSVQASTTPKMLFSPLTQSTGPITLTAEAYAMPFGGKMGPWYYDSWPQNAGQSMGQTQIDLQLPPRMDANVTLINKFPNYSRYPGDQLGMQSALARHIGVQKLGAPTLPYWADYSDLANVDSDPVVAILNAQTPPVTRQLEIAAISPDLFDAAYYSVNYQWTQRLGSNEAPLFQNVCQNSCYNLGSLLSPTPANIDVPDQAKQRDLLLPDANWQIPAAQIQTVNTSWSQGNPGEYDGAQAAISAGQTFENFPSGKPAGGRVGYSVKLVSKKFLQSNNLPLGGNNNGAGSIANPPN